MKETTLAMFVALAVSGPALAGPFQKDWVAADAMWLIHVDLEALAGSTIGSFILEHADELDLELDDFERETGLDPRTDLMSVTAYGFAGDPEEDGVIVAVTSAEADAALERLLESEEIESQEVEVEGYRVHAFRDGDERHYLHVGRSDRPGRRVVVLSDDVLLVANALKVIDDRAPSLRMGKPPMPARPQDGSIVFIAVTRLGELDAIEPVSKILRLSDGVVIDVGEVDEVLHGEATVSVASQEKADDIVNVIEGLVALGHLVSIEEDLGPMGRVIDSLSVKARDGKITVGIQYPSKQLIEVLEMIEDDEDDHEDRDDDDDDDDDDHEGDHDP